MENKNILNYIDKLWDVLKSLQRSANRAFILLMIFSLIFLFLGTGLVSVNESYILFGMHIVAKTWVIFILGILVQNLLFIYLFIAESRSDTLKGEILETYKKIGVEINDNSFLNQTNLHHILYIMYLFDDDNKDSSLVEQILMVLLGIAILVIIFLFPLVTVIFLSIRLLMIFNTNWLFWPIILALSIFPAVSYTVLVFRMFKKRN